LIHAIEADQIGRVDSDRESRIARNAAWRRIYEELSENSLEAILTVIEIVSDGPLSDRSDASNEGFRANGRAESGDPAHGHAEVAGKW
jgi:hypothetical protein